MMERLDKIIEMYDYLITIQDFDDGVSYKLWKRVGLHTELKEDLKDE